jgi:hypothetical protein
VIQKQNAPGGLPGASWARATGELGDGRQSRTSGFKSRAKTFGEGSILCAGDLPFSAICHKCHVIHVLQK